MTLSPDVQSASDAFSKQQTFDPWILSTTDINHVINAYVPMSNSGAIVGGSGLVKTTFNGGSYVNGVISHQDQDTPQYPTNMPTSTYTQTLNMERGYLTCQSPMGTRAYGSYFEGNQPWPAFWARYDISITGDTEAQQITHANLFYLAGSAAQFNPAIPSRSIGPMGDSSLQYNGHIFWDAEIWMMPALIVQHPDLAYAMLDYRFKRLGAAEALAKSHGYKGAEFPWESADTGKEEAPGEFSSERHITADIAFAAWQYYLWTGDTKALKSECWPIIKDNAEYWASRVIKDSDGKYHIDNVIGPDETSEIISDDAWTNAIVATTLRDATVAASRVGEPADPKWDEIAGNIFLAEDPTKSFYVEYPGMPDRLQAKQADTQMLIYPLNLKMSADCAGKTLDFAISHTIKFGPAMTDSINTIDAARLGRAQQSIDLFNSSYRPFMRGPWDAFSEKRSTNGVYFCTGMGGCLQAVLYGFGGLQLYQPGETPAGTLIAKGKDASLYVNPHIPPGWTELVIKGVQFQGHNYNVDVKADNSVLVSKVS